MAWTTTQDPETFHGAAGAFLRGAPATNSVIITAVEALRARVPLAPGRDTPLLGWWAAPGRTATAAFMHTPGMPLVVTAMPEDAVAPLVETILATGREQAGVTGSPSLAQAFAGAWSARTGASAHVHRRLCLHRLGDLVPPAPPPDGAPRIAAPDDLDLLLAWYDAFIAEIDEFAADVPRQVDARLAHAGLTLWIADGERVALAGSTRLVGGMARVAPVYTPPAHRGRGYAAGATAAVTQGLLDAGAREVLLYTDLANPTSNRLYRRLGYVPVEEVVALSFAGG